MRNFLKKQYKESFNFIKESRSFIYGVVGVFFVFCCLGFFLPVPLNFENEILKFIEELIEKTKDMGQFDLILYIFWNNFQSSFFGIFLGSFFGVFSVLLSVVNGYVLGFVAMKSVEGAGILSLWRIFPHGIFELPAVFISLGIGIKLGTFVLQKKKIEFFRKYFWNCARVLVFVVLPLLIVAAIIEGSLIFVSR